MEGHAINENCG